MEKSGFPLEIEVGSLFSNRSWGVNHQRIFFDDDDKKNRYVDLSAHKTIHQKFHKFDRLSYTVICECKKSDKPWVFYTPPTDSLTKTKDLSTLAYLKYVSGPSSNFKEPYILYHNHYVSKDPLDRIGQAYYLAFAGEPNKRKSLGYDQVYEAINQVLKATIFSVQRMKGTMSLIPYALIVYYQLIVLEGKLFQYTLSDKHEAQLEPASYVKNNVDYLVSPTVEGWTDRFLIDVVTKEFLPTYLDWLDEEMETLVKGKS